jgi:hypothetical protein
VLFHTCQVSSNTVVVHRFPIRILVVTNPQLMLSAIPLLRKCALRHGLAACRCSLWVITGNPWPEHMTSALLPDADIHGLWMLQGERVVALTAIGARLSGGLSEGSIRSLGV